MTATVLDEAKLQAFMGKAMTDLAGAETVLLAIIGDRLGLFKALAESRSSTSNEFAVRAGIDERYAREWLAAMTAAGYVEHDATEDSFVLPHEHQGLLADEGGPMFFGGMYQSFAGQLAVVDRVTDAFRTGGGVPQSAYNDDFWTGAERMTAAWFDHQLVPVWLLEMPDVEDALRRGADVADVGCGRGRALIKLARSFPASRYVGFDAFAPTVSKANANAAASGVGSLVRFEHADGNTGLAPESFDVIFTFDVIHDAIDPAGLLVSIRRALKPGGTYVCVDINCAPTIEGNVGQLGAMLYGISVMYCMTTSLANDGAGLGTCGFHEAKVEEMCLDAGFSSVRKLPIENAFNNVYEVKA